MTNAEKLGARLGREETFAGRQMLFPSRARPVTRNHRHEMRVSEQRRGMKPVLASHTNLIITNTDRAAQTNFAVGQGRCLPLKACR